MNQPPSQATSLQADTVSEWLVAYLAGKLSIDPQKIDTQATFADHGVDSMIAIVMSGDLSSWAPCDLNPTALYEYPSIAALAQHVSELTAGRVQQGCDLAGSEA
ncbi:acyl carrier protein (plasmid) [Ralstonia solanacearum]|nr:acyl carrier protein [Ralstonia solanacearum FJAT-1458]QKL74274.1 acyl carrier protein [Ralstonia solanacearum]QKL79478.1 acyl carrier protein [Ralstonia solanacearum]QKL84686.1 acyl carrier protein [Ralstonia solanacearum]QKL89900.1 acyl carrier protein [Ralstonia solanacearum]